MTGSHSFFPETDTPVRWFRDDGSGQSCAYVKVGHSLTIFPPSPEWAERMARALDQLAQDWRISRGDLPPVVFDMDAAAQEAAAMEAQAADYRESIGANDPTVIEGVPGCDHTEGKGLCPTCYRDYMDDPGAYLEFGDHPQGRKNWQDLQNEMANDQAKQDPALAYYQDGPIPF